MPKAQTNVSLTAMCDKALALHNAANAAPNDAAADPIWDEMHDLVKAIANTPANTQDGIRAKAKAMFGCIDVWPTRQFEETTEDRMLASLLRDLGVPQPIFVEV